MSVAAPEISVLIPSVNGLPTIVETLSALEAQSARGSAEIIVLDCTTAETRREIAERFPAVDLVCFDRRLSIPELRRRGLDRARGAIIATLEDHCSPPRDWLERIVAAHRRLPHAAISGTVANGATLRARDWAFYFCEYAALAPPLDAGESAIVAGNCAAYKRAALDAVGGFGSGWEYFLHRRLVAKGYGFYCEPALEVSHNISFPLPEMLAQRFHYSRSFAAMRVEGQGPSTRLAFALAALLVPPLVLWRTTRIILSKRRWRSELVRALPVLSLLALSWGVGELVGAVAGAGTSLESVR